MNARRLAAALLAPALLLAPGVSAEDKKKSGPSEWVEQKTSEGLHFFVPSDWPVERRNGMVSPVPPEEYLGKKFKEMEGRLLSMEQLLQALDIRVRLLEEQAKARPQGLKSSEQVRP